MRAGVPKAFPLSPLLISVTMDDFPQCYHQGETFYLPATSNSMRLEQTRTRQKPSSSHISTRSAADVATNGRFNLFFQKSCLVIFPRKREKNTILLSLFKLLSHNKHGPPIDTLCVLHQSLIHSKLEYHLIYIYGSSSLTLQKKLKVIENRFLRTILGNQNDSRDMQYELEVVPIETIGDLGKWAVLNQNIRLS